MRPLHLAIGLALSAIAFWLFLRNLDFARVLVSLTSANVPLLAASIAIGYFGHMALRARRWATMLSPIQSPIPFYDLFSTTAIGYAVSGLMPGRLGEIVRPVLLARRRNLPVAGVLATAAMERALDVATIVVLAALASLTSPFWWRDARGSLAVHVPLLGERDLVHGLAVLGGAGLVATVAGLVVLRTLVLPGSRFMQALGPRAATPGWKGKAWTVVRHLTEGAAFLRTPLLALRVALESVTLWVVVTFAGWLGLLAAGVRIPAPGMFLLLAITAVGLSVPTPAGAGSVHLAYQIGLVKVFGVEPNLASAATFLYHPVSIYIPPIVFGLAFAWCDGVSTRSIRRMTADG